MDKTKINDKSYMLSFRMENLGPIKEAAIDLGDITLLFGYPNTGKSYAMRAIYGSLSILNQNESKSIKNDISEDFTDIFIKNLSDQLDNIMRGIFFNLSYQLLKYLDEKPKNPEFTKFLETTSIKKVLDDFRILVAKAEAPKRINLDMNIQKKDFYEIINNAIQKNISSFVNWGKKSSIKINDKFIDKIISENDIFLTAIEGKGHLIKTKIPINMLFDLFSDFDKNLNLIFHIYFRDLRDINFPLNAEFVVNNLTKEDEIKLSLNIGISDDIKELEGIFDSIFESLSESLDRLQHNISVKQLIDRFLNDLESLLNLLRNLSVHNLSASDEKKLYSLESLFRIIIHSIATDVADIIVDKVKSIIKYTLDISSVKFIPYGRTLALDLLSETRKRSMDELDYMNKLLKDIKEIPFQSYFQLMDGGIPHLEDERNDIRDLFVPVLGGHIKFRKSNNSIGYEYSSGKYVDIPLSSAMVGEISGIMLPLLSMEEKEVILIEEPEAQLHYSSQVLMGLILIAISKIKNSKLIVSTHSDLLALTIHRVLSENPSKEMIIKLIKKMIENNKKTMKPFVENLAEKVSLSKENFKVDYYYVKTTGYIEKVEEKKLDTEIPGLTEVIEELLNWAFDTVP